MKNLLLLVICAVLLNSCQWVEDTKMRAQLWLSQIQYDALKAEDSAFAEVLKEGKGQVIAGSEVTIKAQETTLMFEPQEVLALPGQKIKIKVVNNLKDPLNFLLLHQGDDPVVVSQLALQMSDENQNWMLPQDYYIAAMGPVLPRKSDKITVQMPDAEGVYYFVSTYPSSPAVLRGKFIVVKKKISEEAKDNSLAAESIASEQTL
ncbi:MAG: hypothetical protein M9899_03870 [Bdellovibrionaceae bacterium]|nr:hypothetical protein [Pseudobdellovibrionaceae bacterium]